MTKRMTYAEAIRLGTEEALDSYAGAVVMGLGVATRAGVFGTTSGLVEKYGSDRIIELPAAENGMTGVAVGMAISGMRPIFVHHRVDFSILALEPLVNQAAKWFYMYGGQATCPLVVRALIGRGWGQGPQHSQSLESWFAHVPGLKVYMPTTPEDARTMLISAVEDPAPVVILEHRWLYGIHGDVSDQTPQSSDERAVVRRSGSDITLVGSSYMTLECLRAADILAAEGVQAEVIDLRSISPLDEQTILSSVMKTGHLVVAEGCHQSFGVAAEVLARLSEADTPWKSAPQRVSLSNNPTPTTPALADAHYPRTIDILHAASRSLALSVEWVDPDRGKSLDQPTADFVGPY